LDRAIEDAPKYGDLNDQLYAFLASSDYNPQPDLEKIAAKLLAINVADDEINPPQLQIFEREMPRVRNGRYVVIPATTYGHSSYGHPEFWQAYLKEFLDSLDHS
jgi:homoserine O-acetyltransferase